MTPLATRRLGRSSLILTLLSLTSPALADDPPKPASPLVKLLENKALPADRQGTVVEMIGKRGSADDLSYLYQRAIQPEGFSEAVRRKALDALSEAALTRQTRPSGDVSGLGGLVRPDAKADPASQLSAIRLAGLWKVESLGEALKAIASSPQGSDAARAAALEALAEIGGAAGRASIEALTQGKTPGKIQAMAVAALTKLDVEAAAIRAVEVLREANSADDLSPLMAAFLNRQGGADKLAAAIAAKDVPADAAKLALRTTYALGRTDPALVDVLSRVAGLNAEVKPLTQPEMDTLIADVGSKGSPERGEDIFRRADLNCTKCHALAGAGGGVGPDLSALGSSSPPDYIINSIFLPDQAIKEEFHTLIVLTTEGQVFQGIVADKDDKRIVLKEATGDQRLIPAADVEDQKEGGSLMPKGLVNFMTRDELADLVRFLSELGKPGPYAIRTTPTVQRWRVLTPVPEDLARSVPDADAFRSEVLEADAGRWLPAYAKVSGQLPVGPLSSEAGSPVVYLQGEVDVTSQGPVTFRLNSLKGLRAWVDDRPAAEKEAIASDLANGRHRLTLRVDTSARGETPVKVEVLKGDGSPAEFTVVGGR
jgi:putative heme-binding domain-containing protein